MEKKERNKKIVALTMFAIAMGLFEAAVVIYLRELYPSASIGLIESLAFPVDILKIEMWREIATIVMLMAVGFIAFKTIEKKFAAFLFIFSIWDLAYYIFLYIFLGWPSSFLATDIYFLIPRPWIGPVWFPLVIFTIIGAFSLRALFKK